MTRKITLVAIVAMLAIGTSAALALGAGPYATNDAAVGQETTTTADGETTTVAESATVTFGNQTSNGTAVIVDEVVVPEGGFVVIHAAENATMETATETETEMATEIETEIGTETTVADGAAAQQYVAGAVLGNSTYLEPGVYENVTVQLNETLDESQVLIAMPHQDTNDNQLYEFPEADGPYTEDGQAVIDWAYVTLQAGANETTEAGETGDETTTEDGVLDDGETTTE